MTSPDLASLKAAHELRFSPGIWTEEKAAAEDLLIESAPALIAEIERLRGDNEATDGTDAAHPSYWRGCDATFAAMSEQLRKILDGEDDCTGVCQEPWDALRRRVLKLRGEVATARAPFICGVDWSSDEIAAAKAIGAAEMCEQIRAEHKSDDGGFDFEGLMYWLDQTAREKKAEAAELRKELA